MKIKLKNKTKRAICIYVIVLLLLYIVVEILPSVTDIFETTQILEPGNLTLSYETTGYFIKEEAVGIAAESGSIAYLVEEKTAVKKGYPVVSVEPSESTSRENPRYTEYTDKLKGFEGLSTDYNAPISGIFSLYIDGYEDYFTFANMEKVKRSTVESLSYKTVDTERSSVLEGEPVYKISGDDNWYILCWVDEETASGYEEGRKVELQLPEGNVEADIYKIKEEKDGFRVIFHLDVYYEAFAESRAEEMTIVTSDNDGLIVDNKCIIEKDGKKGVYVRNKNGEYEFKQIKVISSNGEESVIEDATFIDEEGNQVYTVDVYDEVLKHPQSALEEDEEKEN